MRLAGQLLDALAELALLELLERDCPERLVQLKLFPFGLQQRAWAHEGECEQLERLADKVALTPLIGSDVAQELAERLGFDDRRACHAGRWRERFPKEKPTKGLCSIQVAAGGPRTTRYGGDGREGPAGGADVRGPLKTTANVG